MEPAFVDLAAYYLPLSYSQQVYMYLEKKNGHGDRMFCPRCAATVLETNKRD
jgi:hypothetical protein